jgi:hypothetical protein
MRKVILWFGRIPASLSRYSKVALKATNKILKWADSDIAKAIVLATPTDVDDKLREKIVLILKSMVPVFAKLSDERAKKAVLARIGAEIVAEMDGRKEKTNEYVKAFEKEVGENQNPF